MVNNKPVSRSSTHKCLGVHSDETERHIDTMMICKKAGAGIGAMRRIKNFVPVGLSGGNIQRTFVK